MFSTPRLKTPGTVHLNIPFASTALDELFRAKTVGRDVAELKELLGAPADQALDDLFTTAAPKPRERYAGENMRIRYFGHACLLLETKSTSILVDPAVSYTYDTKLARFTYQDLPEVIDYVVITHGHHDHVMLETLLQLRHKVREVIVPKNAVGTLQDPSLKLLLQKIGFSDVREMGQLETLAFPGGEITTLPFMGEHHDLQVDSKLTYHVRYGAQTVLAAADSCNIEPQIYERIHALIGDVDVLLVGMECDGAPASWVYGPLFTSKPDRDRDHSRRGRGSDCSEAMDLVRRFNCQQVYVYAMGEEPWLGHVLDVHYTPESLPIVQSNLLVETCRREGRVAERLYAQKQIG